MFRLSKPTTKGTRQMTFILPADHPGPVSVVGTFNDWIPGVHTLRKRSNGTLSVAVQVPVGGEITFRYLSEGGIWSDDETADRIDPEGSVVAV